MDFEHYFTNEEVEELLSKWALEYPDFIKLSVIGKSFQGRPIWLASITNTAHSSAEDKPAVWVDGNIHATELSGTTVVLHFINTLLTKYTEDESIKRLLDTCTFYATPRVNPDGAAAAMADRPQFFRSGVRPYPWFDNQEGLQTLDIDGDGRILQMRIPDLNGDWKISKQDPRMMEKRTPTETGGSYYRVFPEGEIINYDGYEIKMDHSRQGLDFNRNFPFEWRPEGDQAGAGNYPTSEPEVEALTRFVTSHPNINSALTFHTFSRLLLRPFSTRSDEAFETPDLWTYQQIGEIGTQLTGYPNVSTYHDFRFDPKDLSYGAFDDWMFDHLGVFTYTVEIWDLAHEAGVVKPDRMLWFRQHPVEDELKIMKWVDQNIGPEGYVAWYSFDHPQLGKIELGGWNLLYTWRNPPKEIIAREAKLHTPFILAMGEMLPHLEITQTKVKKLDNQIYSIDLVVENSGYFGTYTSKQAVKKEAIRQDEILLELPQGSHLISGKLKTEIGFLEGRSNKWGSTFDASSITDNRAHLQWVILANENDTVNILAKSQRAGRTSAIVHLK